MTNTANHNEQHSMFSRVLDWWSSTRDRWAHMAELQRLPHDELERVACDFGVTPSELLAAAGQPDMTHELLDRRLAALGLSEQEIWRLSPMLLRDLQRTCAGCPDRQQCKDDMKISPLEPGWESYCPNSGTLRTLTS